MKLHTSVVDKLISLFETYGGHRNESKLKNVLSQFDLSEYARQSGEKILVATEDLNQAKEDISR